MGISTPITEKIHTIRKKISKFIRFLQSSSCLYEIMKNEEMKIRH